MIDGLSGLTHFAPGNQFPAQSASQLKQTQTAQVTHLWKLKIKLGHCDRSIGLWQARCLRYGFPDYLLNFHQWVFALSLRFISRQLRKSWLFT
jgi:hypothetical protein